MSGARTIRRDDAAATGVRLAAAPDPVVDARGARVELLAPATFDVAAVVGDHVARLPDGLTGRPAQHLTVEATYFDSADLTLAAQGTTLRRNADDTWVIEVSDDAGIVTERFVSHGPDGRHRVPPALHDRLHTRLRSRRLRAVARLVTSRTTIGVFSGAIRLAQISHDDVTVHSSDGVRRFGRVLVAAILPGRPGRAVLRELVDACIAAGCASAPEVNELQLACGVLSPPGAVPAPAMPTRPRSATLAELVAPMLGASVQRLLAHDLGVRLDTDPEDVHQLRVATRRLRADLRALRPLLDRPRAERLRAEASWLASLAGPVRDADVLLERLRATLATLPEVADADGTGLLLLLDTQRRQHHAALLAGMRTERYDALLDGLAEAVAHPPVRRTRRGPPGRRAAATLSRATAKQWQDLVDVVHRGGSSPTAADLHQVRIAAKRVRYTAEAAAPVLGKHAARLAALATRVQTLLGDLHDAVVAEAWLEDAGRDAALAGVTDRLSAVERDRAAQLHDQWRPLWKNVGAKAARELKALPAQ